MATSCGSSAAMARNTIGTSACTRRHVSTDSFPWSWATSSPTSWTMSITSSARWSRKTPTVSTPLPATASTMARACSAVTRRRDGAKSIPTASAPASTATTASAGSVIPQIFTNTPATVPAAPSITASQFPLPHPFWSHD